MKKIIFVLILFFVVGCVDSDEFCGSSSNIVCLKDSDCKVGGCSGQICGAENSFTTCEFRECYDDEKYGLSCGCVDNKCEWN